MQSGWEFGRTAHFPWPPISAYLKYIKILATELASIICVLPLKIDNLPDY